MQPFWNALAWLWEKLTLLYAGLAGYALDGWKYSARSALTVTLALFAVAFLLGKCGA